MGLTIGEKVILVYSARHMNHAPKFQYADDRLVPYREVPGRVEKIKEYLLSEGIAQLVEPEAPISKRDIQRIHDQGMVKYFERKANEILQNRKYIYPSVFLPISSTTSLASNRRLHHGLYAFDVEGPIGKGSWNAILYSATVAATGASILLNREAHSAYALCRPPGHHAGPDFFGGYCYLNNAAIAASKLMDLGKVAIIDIDYHHGNGTQSIFWNDPNVFFASIHADPDYEYPYYSGYSNETGGEKARGTNVNIPLPRGVTGTQYLSALDLLVEKISDFDPASLVVSVGFDTYILDPFSTFKVNIEDFTHIGSALARIGVPTLFIQEGGYKVTDLGKLAASLIHGFLSYQ